MKKTYETDFLGKEPILLYKSITDDITMIKSLNWYNYFYNPIDGKKWIIDYIKSSNLINIELLDKINFDNISITTSSLARMANNIQLPSKYIHELNTKILDVIKFSAIDKKQTSKIKNRDNEILELYENQLDKFYNLNYKYFTPAIEYSEKIKSSDISNCIVYYTKLKDELLLIQSSQLIEGYEHLTNIKLKNYIRFIEDIINQCKIKLTDIPVKVRKIRKAKKKQPKDLVKKLKYCEEFKELGIKSILPEFIIDSKTLYMYNTKYKRISVYHAMSGKLLSIKGSTILNYDEKLSVNKTVRKPALFLPRLLSCGKVELRRILDSINSKEKNVIHGRINKDTILLRVIK